MTDTVNNIEEKGNISIHTENIFPIIKKFLYSDNEIFLRELVSNAVDATKKLQALVSMGEMTEEIGDTKIKVSFDKEAKTITISDKGVGMNAEEIKKYINQIAFSGATEFVEKYKDKAESGQIIGHFGLGFYSAFMVSKQVEIITKSYRKEDEAARWICDGSTSYEISKAEKTERGTDIILHIAEDSEEFLSSSKISSILNKYGKFLPVEIEFEQKVINSTTPIWTKNPANLTDEDYKNFYKELYPMSEEPLFWIHLNVDYPFNLTGILYFPKVKQDMTHQKEKIQLYSRQVFITDEVKDIVPEFLMLLHGVIDSPDIPLNVSRSFLQADSNVNKINNYITKKVAEKLNDLFKNDRESFESKWESIGTFVKYGMISDEKFYDRAQKFALFTSIEGKNHTIDEYLTLIEANQIDKNENKVILYSSDLGKQDAFIVSAKKRNYDVLDFTGVLDSHFIQALERKLEKVTFKRVDSETIDKLIEKGEAAEVLLTEDQQTKLKEIFKTITNNDKLEVKVEALPEDELPVLITIPEYMRRMQEMATLQGFGGYMNMPGLQNVTLNGNSKLMRKLAENANEDENKHLAQQAYDIALLSQNLLTGKELTKFIERSITIIS